MRPQNASELHRASLPATALALDPVTPLDAAVPPVTNCAVPHTWAFDQVEMYSKLPTHHRSGRPNSWSQLKVAMGDIAVPLATAVLLRAASTST